MVKFFFLVLFFAFSLLPGNSEIVFSGLDVHDDDRLLFRAETGYGSAVQDAVFITRLPGIRYGGIEVQQLSVYPEEMELFEASGILQIRNAFGTLRVPASGGLPYHVPGLPSFAGGNHTISGRTEQMAPSADGRWLLYLSPTSSAQGNLILLDVDTGARIQIAAALDLPERFFPASWSPDSRFFVYERGGNLFYYVIGSPTMPADERVRFVGEGAVNSIVWAGEGDFFYLQGSTLYQVRAPELFARTLYGDFLPIGRVSARLPFEFDPSFDQFWIAPDARSILVSRSRRSLFYFPLGPESPGSDRVLPVLLLPRSASDMSVLWPAGGRAVVLVSSPGQERVDVWGLDTTEPPEGRRAAFEPLPPPGPGSFSSGKVSPNGRLAVFWGEGGILLYDYVNWRLLEVLSFRRGLSCLWVGSEELIIGDDQKIERIRFSAVGMTGRSLISLSGIEQYAFFEGNADILARVGSQWYVTNGRSPWTETSVPRPRSPSLASEQHRVYLEAQGPGIYANLPMIRNLASVGTFSLFPPVERPPSPGHRNLALSFDLYDDDQGLPETLAALARFGIRATFFLNGEFIRRHISLRRDTKLPPCFIPCWIFPTPASGRGKTS